MCSVCESVSVCSVCETVLMTVGVLLFLVFVISCLWSTLTLVNVGCCFINTFVVVVCCVCVFVFICMYVYVCVFMCVCVCVYWRENWW